MDIRKINENKVQIIITRKDLEERDFIKGELMPLSPKTQKLFQDLLELAYHECGFEIEEDTQLMVEAYPLSRDSVAIIITKIKATRDYELEQGDFFADWAEETCDFCEGHSRSARQIWCFADLETCTQACARVVPDYVEQSALYKYQDCYYLAVDTIDGEYEAVAAILGEYGDYLPVDAAFFTEHGQELISREAVINLASLVK